MTPARKISNETALKETFRQIEQAELPESKPAMADLIVERSPGTFQAWAREKLLLLIGRMWPKPPSPYQGCLFSEMELEKKIPQPKGKFVKFLDATVSQLRASIPITRRNAKDGALQRIDPDLEKRQQFINEMSPFAAAHHSKDTPFTARLYLEMRARGEVAPAEGYDRSEVAKKAWAQKTPQQRRAIAKKRSNAMRETHKKKADKKKRDGED